MSPSDRGPTGEPADGREAAGEQALFDAVLGGQGPAAPKRSSVHLAAWLVALCAHLGLLYLANRAEPSLETWSARMAALIHDDLSSQASVAIEPSVIPPAPPKPPTEAPPPPPAPQAAPEPEAAPEPVARPNVARRPSRPPARSPTPPTSPEPAPPAEAPELLATEPAGPADFTDSTFVTGTARVPVGGAVVRGGVSRPTGTATPSEVRTPTASAGPATGSRARAVQLAARDWRCAWPTTAVARDIYEQFVVLRVVVGPDGSVERATVTDDPGQGFGAAARACALRTKFSPALDRSGRPVRASSPPIRVRFTR